MNNKELDNCIINFINGDESSFDSIYHETKDGVYLSIRKYIKDQYAIEDLMQDTYMKALKSLNYYTLGTNFKAWISKIAQNNTINYLNRKKREDIIDSNERPDIYGGTEESYFLDYATRNLSELEKDIVIYKIILDLKFKEISEILNMPLGTVYWNYRNALNKMRKEQV